VIVVDASVLATALVDDGPDGELARLRLVEARSLHAPHLIDLEVLSVLRRQAAEGRLSDRRATLAIEDMLDLAIVRYPHFVLVLRSWKLRDNLTPYDAAYVTLAEALGCPLVTADRRIAGAPGLSCRVEILGAH